MRRNMRGRMSRRRFLGSAAAGVGAAALGAAGMAHAVPGTGGQEGGALITWDPIYYNPVLISYQDDKTGLVVLAVVKDSDGNNLMTGHLQLDIPGLDALYGEVPQDFSMLRGESLPFYVWENPSYGGETGKFAVVMAARAGNLSALDDMLVGFGLDLRLQVTRVSGLATTAVSDFEGLISACGTGTTVEGETLTISTVGTPTLVELGPEGPYALDIGYLNHSVVKLH